MEQPPIEGKPAVNPADQILIEAYQQERIKQADRFADLTKELLKLELAIPGIYAAALKLVTSQDPATPSAFWVSTASRR
jgi:hypothetical protein